MRQDMIAFPTRFEGKNILARRGPGRAGAAGPARLAPA